MSDANRSGMQALSAPPADPVDPALIWQVDLHKRLHQRQNQGLNQSERSFELQVRWRSRARRLVLFGPSGAGKSQTLQMIAGLQRPDNGRLVLAGHCLFDSRRQIDLAPRARGLAYVFQDYALFPHLDVRQNIAFGLQRGWINPSALLRDARVEQWLERFGLQAVARQRPHQLSGGQRQRTALARALVGQPKALLLDEPFAALDKPLRQRLREELAEWQDRLQLPMLLISHDEDDLRLLADEVLPLAAGRIVPGAPDEAADSG
jgi:molybdate transport system ATP-binding protein